MADWPVSVNIIVDVADGVQVLTTLLIQFLIQFARLFVRLARSMVRILRILRIKTPAPNWNPRLDGSN